MLDEHGVDDSNKKLTSGKAGDLSVLLRATTAQLNIRAFKVSCVGLVRGR